MKCAVCGKTDHLLLCSRCHKIAYCGPEHQRQDWKRHKPLCIPDTPAKPKDISPVSIVADCGTDSEGAVVTASDVESGFTSWHDKTVEYWGSDKSTVSGMLGGLPHVDAVDLTESRAVVDMLSRGTISVLSKNARKKHRVSDNNVPLFEAQYAATDKIPQMQCRRVLDCGAGIGRVTRGVFADRFNRLDLVEQNGHYLDVARDETLASFSSKLGDLVASPLQQFDPSSLIRSTQPVDTTTKEGLSGQPFDLIWIQWVILYLSDTELIDFLHRCRAALVQDGHGYIVIKDNVTRGDKFWVDRDDGSLIRNDGQMRDVFRRAGMRLLLARLQPDFPSDLIPIMTYVLQ